MEQVAITITGILAIWLANDQREGWRKYACLFGLVGQPFWFYSAFSAEQWGVLVLTAFYTWAWLKGLWGHWLRGSQWWHRRCLAGVE